MSSDHHGPAAADEALPSFETGDDVLDAMADRLQSIAQENAFYDWMDLEVADLEPGRARLRLPFDGTVTTPSPPAPPTVHGGLVATLVDLAGVVALFAARGEVVGIASADLNVDFHGRATEPLIADGVVVNDGSTLGTARVSVYPAETTDADPVATGRTTVRFLDSGEGG